MYICICIHRCGACVHIAEGAVNFTRIADLKHVHVWLSLNLNIDLFTYRRAVWEASYPSRTFSDYCPFSTVSCFDRRMYICIYALAD